MNSTFYRPANERTLDSWIKRTKNIEFRFSLKVPGEITHENLITDTNRACSMMYEFENTHLQILAREDKLGAVLVQLPPFFKIQHLDKLAQFLSSFSVMDYRVFVEVRQKELYQNREIEAVIHEEGASMVSVDSPEATLENNFHTSGSVKYIRLHGRNNSMWWKRGATRDEKYDYEYSEAELVNLKNTVYSSTSVRDEIFIYFNNHPSGKAPRNASRFSELIGMVPGGNRQNTLM